MTPTTCLDVAGLLAESAVLSDSHAAGTRKAYANDWQHFCAWCAAAGRDPLPASAETVLLYLVDMLHNHKIVTVSRYGSAIRYHHQLAGLPLDLAGCSRRLLAGAQRIRGERPLQKHALTVGELGEMCRTMGGYENCRLRNRSILTLGFASALRRSNLVALDLADVEFVREGLVICVRKEKQDQQSRGRQVGIAYGQRLETCPIMALRAWLRVRGVQEGPLYLPVVVGRIGDRRLAASTIAWVVKRAGRKIGLDPAALGGHSLRSGMITEALLHGVDSVLLAEHTGHRSLNSLRRYFRRVNCWQANASAMIGL